MSLSLGARPNMRRVVEGILISPRRRLPETVSKLSVVVASSDGSVGARYFARHLLPQISFYNQSVEYHVKKIRTEDKHIPAKRAVMEKESSLEITHEDGSTKRVLLEHVRHTDIMALLEKEGIVTSDGEQSSWMQESARDTNNSFATGIMSRTERKQLIRRPTWKQSPDDLWKGGAMLPLFDENFEYDAKRGRRHQGQDAEATRMRKPRHWQFHAKNLLTKE